MMFCEASYRLLKSMDEAPQILQVIPVAGEIASQADNHHTGLRVSAQLAPNRENSHHGQWNLRKLPE